MIDLRPAQQADLPRLRSLWKDCFGDPEDWIDLFFRTAYAPSRSLVLTQGGTILGAGYWMDCALEEKPVAYLYAIAIDPRFQHQGFGTALLKGMHARLAQQGYTAALLVPGSASLRRFYEKLGYRTCSHRPAPDSRIPQAPISPAQYARQRRAFLPGHGIVQEGPQLQFLAEQAQFFAELDCIAAVSTEDGRCLELLGTAPPKTGEAFAMCLPLTDAPFPPEVYFAFAFD